VFVSEELDEGHDLAGFDSGKPELDEWLRRSAHHAKDMRTGRTFVWHAGDRRVIAYYTLVGHKLTRQDTPKKIGRGSPDEIPAILLARLALDRRFQSRHLGGHLLAEALEKALESSRLVAARFVVVDAIDEPAARFYTRFGFEALPDNPHRLIQKMSAIEAAYGR
jgi:GNAT superfamily N-acetyltransferase